MNDNINFGEQYKVSGKHAVGKIETNYRAQGDQASFRELIEAVRVLRGQVSAADRDLVDQSLETVSRHEQAEPSKLRRALADIAGVATVVGQVGVPVISAVQKVMAALGS